MPVDSLAPTIGGALRRLSLAVSLSWLLAAAAQAQGLVAYQGGVIETLGPAGRLENASLLLRDGVIVDVGPDIEIPDTAKIVDVRGQTLMPALIDLYHPISLGASQSEPEFRTVTFGGRTFQIPTRGSSGSGPFLKVADNLDPRKLEDDLHSQARLGIGLLNAVTAGYGQAAHLRVTPKALDTALDQAEGYLYLRVTNDTASLQLLRSGLAGEPVRGSSRFGGRGGGGRGRGRGGPPPSSGASAGGAPSRSSGPPPSASVALWKKVKDGEARLIVNVNNAAAILHLLEAAKDSPDARIVLVANGDHLYQTLDAVKQRPNLSVVVRPEIDTEPDSAIRLNVPRLLHEAGVEFAFSLSLRNDTESLVDAPLFPIALLVQTGLDRDLALQSLTATPARILGVDKTVGTLEKDKKANILFVEGDPLDPASHIRQLMVEGRIVHEG